MTAGGEQVEGHQEPEQAPPDEVPLAELKRRADIKFSGETGAVVASGAGEATSALTYGLINDVIDVIHTLPDALFDRHAEHRPCGLLDRYAAAAMLAGDVVGRPLMPWLLAEPIGKAMVKLKKEIPEAKKKAKRKAKHSSTDPEEAAAAVLRRRVKLKLPSPADIKAAWSQIARAARVAPTPELTPSPEPPPAPEPCQPPAPEPLICSADCCSAQACPRARAMIEKATSQEVAVLIINAFRSWWYRKVDSFFSEQAEHAQVAFKHAMRRLRRAYPGDFCEWSEQSPWAVVLWTIRCKAVGVSIPAAVAAARMIGFDFDRAAAEMRVKMQLDADAPERH